MRIEKGKFYRTRGGEKVEVLTTERNDIRNIVYIMEGGVIRVVHRNGMMHDDKSESVLDLIAEWTDPVEIPWSDYPTWCKWIAMDEDKCWFGYYKKPIINNNHWVGNIPSSIHPDYTPRNFTGDWTESLFERPCE